jgi:ribosomal protein S5
MCFTSAKGKAANDLKAWDAAIERAKANLAHQMLRNTNADLQLRHASNAHKVTLARAQSLSSLSPSRSIILFWKLCK